MTSGRVSIVAAQRSARTVIERLHYDGIARCSRPLGGKAETHLVLAQLGPGTMGGDDVRLEGRLRYRARLRLSAQSATRVLGGSALGARSSSAWRLDEGAHLAAIAGTVIAPFAAVYRSTLVVDLAAGASVILGDTIAASGTSDVVARTTIRRDGSDWIVDAFDASAAAPHAVGSLLVAGVALHRTAAVAARLDACAAAARSAGMRVGIGSRPGAVIVRIAHDDVWSVQSLVAACAAVASQALETD